MLVKASLQLAQRIAPELPLLGYIVQKSSADRHAVRPALSNKDTQMKVNKKDPQRQRVCRQALSKNKGVFR
jgi:hypothetical protein